MGEGPGPVGEGLSGSDSDRIRRDIEQTREQLGDTVGSLAEKADVKAQAQEKVSQLRSTVQEKATDARQTASAKADELTGKAKETAPSSANEAAQRASEMARKNPVPVSAGASFVVGVAFGRLMGRRKYRKKLRANG